MICLYLRLMSQSPCDVAAKHSMSKSVTPAVLAGWEHEVGNERTEKRHM